MDREIKFRGKSTPTGDWVYGYYFSDKDLGTHHIFGFDYYTDEEGPQRKEFNTRVFSKTIGQYTGLKDKNGIKIYEGDIVHCMASFDNADMVVIFENGEFRMVLCEKYKEYIENCGYYNINNFNKRVIGNITDNPELLGAN